MIHHITYASENMMQSARLCSSSAIKHGADESRIFMPDSYPENNSFNIFNWDILKSERGNGYWLWKPYFILLMLEGLQEDDIVVYSDAGVEFINDLSHIQMDEDIFFFGNNYNHVEWCKADVIHNISYHYDNDKHQVQASVILFKNTQKVRDFVKEWLLWCQMPGFIDDSPSKLSNAATFKEHRHDQAILTCLQIKHGYKLHYWPASYNNGLFDYPRLPEYKDSYPILFNHHRKRNNEW